MTQTYSKREIMTLFASLIFNLCGAIQRLTKIKKFYQLKLDTKFN